MVKFCVSLVICRWLDYIMQVVPLVVMITGVLAAGLGVDHIQHGLPVRYQQLLVPVQPPMGLVVHDA